MQQPSAAMASVDGQQAKLARTTSCRQMGVEIRNLVVERKGTRAAHGDHAQQFGAAHADDVGVLAVEPIDQSAGRVGRVLGNLLDEGLIVEAMDRIELPRFGGDPHTTRRAWELVPVREVTSSRRRM